MEKQQLSCFVILPFPSATWAFIALAWAIISTLLRCGGKLILLESRWHTLLRNGSGCLKMNMSTISNVTVSATASLFQSPTCLLKWTRHAYPSQHQPANSWKSQQVTFYALAFPNYTPEDYDWLLRIFLVLPPQIYIGRDCFVPWFPGMCFFSRVWRPSGFVQDLG